MTINDLSNLAHSKPVEGSTINNKPVRRLSWNTIMMELVELAANENNDITHLSKTFGTSFSPGRKKGYMYVKNADVCIRGKGLRWVGRIIENGAKALNVPVHIKYQWTDKAGEDKRGRIGFFEIN